MVEIKTETVIEIVEVELEPLYSFEGFREMAKAGAYEGNPAAGHTMAFANIMKSLPFCTLIENNIIEEWKLAGGYINDLTLLDNAADTSLAVQNADIVFNKDPEVFLEFQFDFQINAQIGRKAKELGIFIIAIDVPVLGFPFMGVDNYGSSVLIGNWAIEQIKSVYGGWEKVDRVFFLWNPDIDGEVAMRINGSRDVFKERFGDEADDSIEGSKAVIVDAGSTTDEAESAMTDILTAYPNDNNVMVFCLNDQTAAGVQSAADNAGRWDPDKWMI
ncbi:MAG: substrate-binding domain-containing protein, partial [Candidatus Humimicrobiaceae bacterium]